MAQQTPQKPQNARRQRIAARVAARQGRREERRNKQVENFVGPYTPKQAHKIAKNTVKTEFGPTQRQIESEIRGTKKREGEIGDWYSQLEDQYKQGATQAASAADAANSAVASSLGQTSSNTASLLTGLAGKDAAFAAQVGGPTDAAGQTKEVEAAAAAERLRAALQAPNVAAREINVADYGGKAATAALSGIQAHKENATTRAKDQADLRALKGERGSAITKTVAGLREQAQNYLTQQKALGTKTGYNKAIEEQAKLGLASSKVTAAATVASAHAYAAAKKRGADATEAAAAAYSAAKERGATAQEATAASQKAAAKIKAASNENVAKQQGQNQKTKPKSGYTIQEAESLAKEAGVEFSTPGEVVDYLVNRGVKRGTAKQAAGKAWRAAHAAG
jgi:hypothetical protein